jgi:hypothetical protein
MNSKTQRRLLRLLGPLLLLVVVVKLPDPAALWHQVSDAFGWELIVGVALNGVALVLKVDRWRRLLKTRDISYAFRDAWRAFTAVLYIGLLTPGRVGDVLRVKYLQKSTGASYADGLASIAVDRICDIYVLLGFVAVGIARFSEALAGDLARVTWLGVAVCALAPLVILVPGVADRGMRAVYAKIAKHDEAKDGMDRFLHSLRTQSVRGAAFAVPLTVAAFVVNYVQGWLVVKAMGLELQFIDVVALLALASLFSLLPISVSGVGVRELLFAVVFPFLGQDSQSGVSYGLLIFSVIYLPLVVYGFYSWQVAPLPLGAASDAPARKGDHA